MTLDDLTNVICSCLDDALRDRLAGELRNSRRGWTGEVRKAISDLGKSLKFEVAPSEYEGEWLYDTVWYDHDGQGFFVNQKLVMECEYTIASLNTVDDDFCKLVQARTDVRMWISTSANKTDTQRHIENCKKQIRLFEGSQSGDRYVFLFFEWDARTHSLETFSNT
jgi:hypothetical protein